MGGKFPLFHMPESKRDPPPEKIFTPRPLSEKTGEDLVRVLVLFFLCVFFLLGGGKGGTGGGDIESANAREKDRDSIYIKKGFGRTDPFRKTPTRRGFLMRDKWTGGRGILKYARRIVGGMRMWDFSSL